MNKTFKQRWTMALLIDPNDESEEVCQTLLALGEEWQRDKQLDIWGPNGRVKKKYLYGKDGLARTLLNGLIRATDSNSISDEQAIAVMASLRYIHIHGRKKWLEDAKKHREPSDFFEWPQEGSKLLKK